jgi:hypothetical protein
MESEDQTEQDLDHDTGNTNSHEESLYPKPPEKSAETKTSKWKRSFGNQGFYPSKPIAQDTVSSPIVTGVSNPERHRPRKGQPSSYYHPNDYYLGTDWPRLIVGTLASLILLVSVGILALYLFDRFESGTGTPQVLTTSNDETTVISAYMCAGDTTPVKQIDPPPSALFSGKNAAGTWIAYQDPVAPSVQLWSRTDDLPVANLDDLQVVNCENLDDSEVISDS